MGVDRRAAGKERQRSRQRRAASRSRECRGSTAPAKPPEAGCSGGIAGSLHLVALGGLRGLVAEQGSVRRFLSHLTEMGLAGVFERREEARREDRAL